MRNPKSLETEYGAQAYMKILRDAWLTAKNVSRTAQRPDYEIEIPKHLWEATRGKDQYATLEAWEAINYYQQAVVLALQKVERETYQEMVRFEREARLVGFKVGQTEEARQKSLLS